MLRIIDNLLIVHRPNKVTSFVMNLSTPGNGLKNAFGLCGPDPSLGCACPEAWMCVFNI